MNRIYKKLGWLRYVVVALGLVCLPTFAQAEEDCDSLEENATWNEGLMTISNALTEKDYETAKKQARVLNAICSRSPILNYMQGKIAMAQNDEVEARFFFQKASEATYEFAVTPELSQKIWYDRYEAEHPERTAEAVNRSNEEFQLKLSETATSFESKLETKKERLEKAEKLNRIGLWSSVGVGVVGLAALGTGIGLAVSSKDTAVKINYNSAPKTGEVKGEYVAGWSLIGAGIVATVVGAALSGVYGAKVAESAKQGRIDVAVSPVDISVSVKF